MFPASRSQQVMNTEYAFCVDRCEKNKIKKETRLDRLCKEHYCEIMLSLRVLCVGMDSLSAVEMHLSMCMFI